MNFITIGGNFSLQRLKKVTHLALSTQWTCKRNYSPLYLPHKFFTL